MMAKTWKAAQERLDALKALAEAHGLMSLYSYYIEQEQRMIANRLYPCAAQHQRLDHLEAHIVKSKSAIALGWNVEQIDKVIKQMSGLKYDLEYRFIPFSKWQFSAEVGKVVLEVFPTPKAGE